MAGVSQWSSCGTLAVAYALLVFSCALNQVFFFFSDFGPTNFILSYLPYVCILLVDYNFFCCSWTPRRAFCLLCNICYVIFVPVGGYALSQFVGLLPFVTFGGNSLIPRTWVLFYVVTLSCVSSCSIYFSMLHSLILGVHKPAYLLLFFFLLLFLFLTSFSFYFLKVIWNFSWTPKIAVRWWVSLSVYSYFYPFPCPSLLTPLKPYDCSLIIFRDWVIPLSLLKFLISVSR